MDNISQLVEQLNLTEEKAEKILKEFKNMKPNQMSSKDVNKLASIVGLTPKTLAKTLRKNIPKPPPKISKRIGRNQKCPCGSNKKYKVCCIGKLEPKAEVITKENPTQKVELDRSVQEEDIDMCHCGSGIPLFACCVTEEDPSVQALDKELESELAELNDN